MAGLGHRGLVMSWTSDYSVSGVAYSASKLALNALCATINMEECKHYILATALCPGEVATDILNERPHPPSREERAKML
jgi:NAD(P)-dependent dehydrogenase (short-subunit alcohol dehydrogenase family)